MEVTLKVLEISLNKTPGYLRYILHPPALLKMSFRKMKASFSQILIIIFKFFNFKLFRFMPKNIKKRSTDILDKNYHMRRIPETIYHKKRVRKDSRFSRKKNRLFFRNNPTFERFEVS